MCIDFTNLNEVCPKDSFLFPRIDQRIEAMAGQELSFIDAYPRYNQIKMHLPGKDNTAFIIGRGIYYYRMMPFELKNVGATF